MKTALTVGHQLDEVNAVTARWNAYAFARVHPEHERDHSFPFVLLPSFLSMHTLQTLQFPIV